MKRFIPAFFGPFYVAPEYVITTCST